jgi:sequestosome 1
MAQENTVSFKVFLLNKDASEVRRFGVDRDVVSNFSYLREKLQTVFPSLRGRDFTVAWKGNQN